MERITDITKLQAGDKIVRVYGGKPIFLEFLCLHPHNTEYSIFMNENKDGEKKFYNNNLVEDEWYRFTGSDSDWDEIYDMEIEWHKKCIVNLERRKVKRETTLVDHQKAKKFTIEDEEVDLGGLLSEINQN